MNIFSRGKSVLVRYQHDLRRRNFENLLAGIVSPNGTESLLEGQVLIDGTYDNPNYWLRVAIFMSSMGISFDDCCGLLGPSRRREQSRTLRRFGIKQIFDLVIGLGVSATQ